MQGRTENYATFNASLTYPFWRDLMNFSVFYRYQERTSDIETYGYTVTAYGMGFTYFF